MRQQISHIFGLVHKVFFSVKMPNIIKIIHKNGPVSLQTIKKSKLSRAYLDLIIVQLQEEQNNKIFF